MSAEATPPEVLIEAPTLDQRIEEPSTLVIAAGTTAMLASGAIGGVGACYPGWRLMGRLIPPQARMSDAWVEKAAEAVGTGVIVGAGASAGIFLSVWAINKLFGDQRVFGKFQPGSDI